MRLCLFTTPGLLSGTFSDKPIRSARRLTHSAPRGDVQSTEGLKVLSDSKASSFDWWRKIVSKPETTRAEGQSLRLSVNLSVMLSVSRRCSSYTVLLGLESLCLSAPAVGAYLPLTFSVVWGIPITP
uniref:Uncharacterized protein n=1 Tax=Rousettus aegyptiacus TaxID=9407 RepID=A0A7J8KAH7_ROUAE|nr:hypothetical protein HJG63_007767 [Rousettus aegyptiacus]